MSTSEALTIAIFAGIVVAGCVWFSLGLLGNLRYALSQRSKAKSEGEAPAPEGEE